MNRKKIISLTLIISVFVLIGSVSAETLDMSNNECVYMPEINKDFCKTEYELCDPSLSEDKISFLYGDLTENVELGQGEFKAELPELEAEIKIEDEGGCYKVEVSGYKSPLLDIDNVLCFENNCHWEYALWIGSYNHRQAVYGNVADLTAPTSGMIPINMSMNTSAELFWCNFTVNTTNSTLGYVYWNNHTSYICIDPDETTAVTTVMDEGNASNYGSLDTSLKLWLQHNDTLLDVTSNSYDFTATGPIINDTGQIGKQRFFDGTNDYLQTTGNVDINWDAGVTECVWIQFQTPDSWVITDYRSAVGNTDNWLFYTTGAAQNHCPIIDVWTDAGVGEVYCTYDINDNDFHHVCWSWNSTSEQIKVYVDGSIRETGSRSGNADKSTTTLRQGTDKNTNSDFEGYMDNLMIWNEEISGNEINLTYHTQLSFVTMGDVETNTSAPTPTPNVTVTYDIEISYCYDTDYLYVVEKDINESGAVFTPYLIYCDNGCDNNTIINLGSAGCKESDMEIALIVIISAILSVAVIYWVVKK